MESTDNLDSSSCKEGDQNSSNEKNEKSERKDPAADEVSLSKLEVPELEANECDTKANCNDKMEAENEELSNESLKNDNEKPNVPNAIPIESSEVIRLEQNSASEETSTKNDNVDEEVNEREKSDPIVEVTPPIIEKVDEPTPRKSEDLDSTETMDDSALIKLPNNNSVQTENIKNGKRKLKTTSKSPNKTSPIKTAEVPPKRRRNGELTDSYCWRCNKEHTELACTACPRSWHRRCMGGAPPLSMEPKNWICSECSAILQAENVETRAPIMAQLSIEQLSTMLKYVVERMREQTGAEPFWKPVDIKEVPNYLDYVVKPMDLSQLDFNIKNKLYGSTEAFMADAKWIQHNCIVYNTGGGVYADESKLTNAAKQILKVARQEISEIETCPDCFAHGRNIPRPLTDWFIEPCRRPHAIVWAKLKGFPFWPAKALSRVNANGLVDVRFFGQHDRAWVPLKDIYLYSEEAPGPMPRKKKQEMDECIKEVMDHFKKLEAKYGEYRFAPVKTLYDPNDPMQIKMLLPNYDPNAVQIETTPVRKKDTPKVADKKQIKVKKLEVKLEAKKPDVKSEVKKPEVKPEVKKPEVKPEVKQEAKKPEAKPDAKKPEAKPDAKKPETTSNSNQTNLRKRKSEVLAQKVDKPETPAKKIATNGDAKILKQSMPEVSIVAEVLPNDVIEKSAAALEKIKKNDYAKKLKLTPTSEKVHKDIKNNSKVLAGAKTIQEAKPVKKIIKIATKSPVVQKSQVANANNATPQAIKTIKTVMNISQPGMAKKTVELKVVSQVTHKNETKVENKKTEKSLNNSDHTNNTPIGVGLRSAAPITIIKKDQSKTNVRDPIHISNNNVSQLSPEVSIIPKEEAKQFVKRESKARKSFPNSNTLHVIPPLRKNSLTLLDFPVGQKNIKSTSGVLPPAEAGPVTASIYRNSQELVTKMAQLIAETIKDAAEGSNSNSTQQNEATIHNLKLQIEKLKWELSEAKTNHDTQLRELKANMESERARVVLNLRKEAEVEKQKCVEETKRKQWCANCGQEAMFYCCWNTSYCDYPCQQKHWSFHMSTCNQKNLSTPQSVPAIKHQQLNTSFNENLTLRGLKNTKSLLKPYKRVPL